MKTLLVVVAFGTVVTMAQAPQTTWSGIYTEAQAAAGEKQYAASCASCHGTDLAGGEMAPSLVGGEFSGSWNDLSVRELFDRIYSSMPLNAPKSLSRQQDAEILAFVLKRNGFPTGQTNLSSQAADLDGIKFQALKP